MDAHRSSLASGLPLVLSRPLSRRRALFGAAGAIAASRGLVTPAITAAAPVSQRLTNPASNILLPGEAGLHGYGLDFTLSGPPAIFFASGDTPGWSESVKSSVSGFVFGYAATLAETERSSPGRAVQVCVHHGYPSEADADVAWSSLTAALTQGAKATADAGVRTLDLVELIVVEGQSILATVAGGDVEAIVLASRTSGELVTVAIADFTGGHPSADEALALAEAEGAKVQRAREIERTDLRSAFNAQWTPGFQLGSAAGAPFFAWPTFLDGAPVTLTGESGDQLQARRAANARVSHQSHIEGPFWETAPLFDTHALYYSAQSNFFDSSSGSKSHHTETKDRVLAGAPDATVIDIHVGKAERRYGYSSWTSIGPLCAITLHKVVSDGDFPLSLALHVVAVPYGADMPELDLNIVIERLDPVVKQMRDGLEECLVAPSRAPLVVTCTPTV